MIATSLWIFAALFTSADARFSYFLRNNRLSSNETTTEQEGLSRTPPTGTESNCDVSPERGGGSDGNTWRSNVTRVGNDCPVREEDPECIYDLNSNESGVWVCRVEFDHETGSAGDSFSYCASPVFRFDSDECGCCNDECPKPCTCPCNFRGGEGNGVLVMFTEKYDVEEKEIVEVCLDPSLAYHQVSKNPHYTCAVC